MKSVANDEFRRVFQPAEYVAALAAGVDPSAADIIPGKAAYAIRVTGIWLNVDTSAAQTLTLRDNGSSPRTVTVFASGTATGSHERKFGNVGFPCQTGEGLDLLASAAGYAGVLVVEAYYEPIGPFTPDTV